MPSKTGLFDDLAPGQGSSTPARSRTGLFDDLAPAPSSGGGGGRRHQQIDVSGNFGDGFKPVIVSGPGMGIMPDTSAIGTNAVSAALGDPGAVARMVAGTQPQQPPKAVKKRQDQAGVSDLRSNQDLSAGMFFGKAGASIAKYAAQAAKRGGSSTPKARYFDINNIYKLSQLTPQDEARHAATGAILEEDPESARTDYELRRGAPPRQRAEIHRQQWIRQYGYDPEKFPARYQEDLSHLAQQRIAESVHPATRFVDQLLDTLLPGVVSRQEGDTADPNYRETPGTTAHLVAGIADLPGDVMGDATVLAHPNSSLRDRIGAIANIAVKTIAPEEILAKGAGPVITTIRTLRAGGVKERQLADAIEQSMRSGASQEMIDNAIRARGRQVAKVEAERAATTAQVPTEPAAGPKPTIEPTAQGPGYTNVQRRRAPAPAEIPETPRYGPPTIKADSPVPMHVQSAEINAAARKAKAFGAEPDYGTMSRNEFVTQNWRGMTQRAIDEADAALRNSAKNSDFKTLKDLRGKLVYSLRAGEPHPIISGKAGELYDDLTRYSEPLKEWPAGGAKETPKPTITAEPVVPEPKPVVEPEPVATTIETPKPKKRTPGPTVEEPPVTAKPEVEPTPTVTEPTATTEPKPTRQRASATGLANQVQTREAENGILSAVEPTKGKSAQEWQNIGKKIVEDGDHPDADFEGLAQRVKNGDVELTGDRVGVLLEGKRRLVNDVEQAKKALDASPGDKGLTARYVAAQDRLQNYVENVQAGKGRWSDVGRALQAGTTLNEGSFAEVLAEAKRTGRVSQRVQGHLEKLTGQVAERDQRIADLEAQLKEHQTDAGVKSQSRRKFDREAIHQEIESLFTEFKSIRGEGGVGSTKTRGAATKITAQDLKNLGDQAKLIGKIGWSYAKLGAASLEDVVVAVQKAFLDRHGVELDRQAVIDAMAAPQGEMRTRTEIQRQLDDLRSEARRASTEAQTRQAQATAESDVLKSDRERLRKAGEHMKLREQIADLEEQLKSGNFREPTPKETEVAKSIRELRAQRDVLAGQVRGHLRDLKTPGWRKAVNEVSGAVRGTILGSDFGVMTRQGLFAWSRPKAALRAMRNAGSALLRDENLAMIERDIREKRINGELAAPIRKEAGLSVTDSMNHPEELVVGRLLKRIPIIGKLAGKPLERAQMAFINTVRSEIFDAAVEQGFTKKELAARARFINATTGRGNLGQVPELFSAVLTSPRYEASRWDTLWHAVKSPAEVVGTGAKSLWEGKGLADLNKGALANVQDMAVTAGGVFTLFKLAELSGYSITWDPTSADFLKMRRGKEVWDVSAGLAPRLRDIMRLYVWGRHPDRDHNIAEVLKGAGVRTISPAVRTPTEQASFAIQRADGVKEKDVVSPFAGFADDDQKSWWSFAPLIVQSMKTALEQGGPLAAASAGAKEFVGGGVNFYGGSDYGEDFDFVKDQLKQIGSKKQPFNYLIGRLNKTEDPKQQAEIKKAIGQKAEMIRKQIAIEEKRAGGRSRKDLVESALR